MPRDGTPFTLEFEGRQYRMSPLTIGDMEEFEVWAKDRCHAEARRRIAQLREDGCYTAEEAQRVLRQAWEEQDKGLAEGRAMQSMAGAAKLAHLSLRREHPELTIEDVGRLVEFRGVGEMHARMDQANGIEVGDPNAEGQPGSDTSGSTGASSGGSAPGQD